MPTLRLSHQLTFAIGGLLLLVGSLVAWNLVITQQLTEAHRSLVDTGLPAMRREVGLLEDLSAGAEPRPVGTRPGGCPSGSGRSR
jgi:hypothetical protein